ncbi:MAG: thioredoxin-like domain-containing protein [Byssovorax sp.]
MKSLACALAPLLLLAGCGENKSDVPPPPPTTGRANAVAAKTTAPAPTQPAHTAPAQSAAPKPPRQLCVGQTQRPAPKGQVKTAAAPGAEAPPTPVPFGVGKWVWVNFWAAWCGPCKEEMPRLLGWQAKLSSMGVSIDFAFVSLDDDERQLQRFLESQPKSGVRASYWLPDGDLRSGWLSALNVKNPPELPLQVLVAPSGQVACTIEGAVEDRDFPAVAAFVGAKK